MIGGTDGWNLRGEDRHYIAGARQKRPTVPPEVSSYIVECYVRLRKQGKEDEDQKKSHTYTSARTLLGVLRLSQALARLRYSDEVEQGDVDEALRLMEVSKESLYDDDDKEYAADRSDISKIFRRIREMFMKNGGPVRGGPRGRKRLGKGPEGERDMDIDSDESTQELSMINIRNEITGRGFTEAQFMQTIIEVRLFCLPKTLR